MNPQQDPTPELVTPTAGGERHRVRLGERKPLHFPTQRPEEHVILLLRRHWTVLAAEVLQLVLSLLIPPVVLGVLYAMDILSLNPDTPLYVLSVFVMSLYYLFSFLAFFHDFVDYHLDIWVVTDQRIVAIEQAGLFNRVISELSLLRIQDVTSEIQGKVQTFLDFGHVHIQTAGETGRFEFEQVPHPAEVAKVILQMHERAMQKSEMDRIRQTAAYQQQMEAQQPTPPGLPVSHTPPLGDALPVHAPSQHVPPVAQPQQRVSVHPVPPVVSPVPQTAAPVDRRPIPPEQER